MYILNLSATYPSVAEQARSKESPASLGSRFTLEVLSRTFSNMCWGNWNLTKTTAGLLRSFKGIKTWDLPVILSWELMDGPEINDIL